jgi:hypothetical protein
VPRSSAAQHCAVCVGLQALSHALQSHIAVYCADMPLVELGEEHKGECGGNGCWQLLMAWQRAVHWLHMGWCEITPQPLKRLSSLPLSMLLQALDARCDCATCGMHTA